MFFLHAGETEVGGFGISATDEELYVNDFITIKQRATCVSVAFDDPAVADYFDTCIDAGLTPARCARIWVHTHPGQSPEPSMTDEETFARVFGRCDWSVMFIVSRSAETYARLSFAAGPGGAILMKVDVDWESWPSQLADDPLRLAKLPPEWIAEYQQNVQAESFTQALDIEGWSRDFDPDDPYELASLINRVMEEPAGEPMVLHDFEQGKGEMP